MTDKYKTTFNYLLTHKVMPRMFFSNLDFFYETIVTDPENMQVFMRNCMQVAIDMTEKHPDIEPAFQIEEFTMDLFGASVEKGVISIIIPNCERDCDCLVVAFPCMRGMARYFTCELSTNPLNGDIFYIIGEWTEEGEGYSHSNYGYINVEKSENFPKKVIEAVYG